MGFRVEPVGAEGWGFGGLEGSGFTGFRGLGRGS